MSGDTYTITLNHINMLFEVHETKYLKSLYQVLADETNTIDEAVKENLITSGKLKALSEVKSELIYYLTGIS